MPVKLPANSVEVILVKPVPTPPVILIVPSVKLLNETEPVPLIFKKFVAD